MYFCNRACENALGFKLSLLNYLNQLQYIIDRLALILHIRVCPSGATSSQFHSL
jgi:hypothetical protein